MYIAIASPYERKDSDMERTRIKDPRDRLRLLRASEVCGLLGISSWTLRAWIRRGKFPRPVFTADGAPARFRAVEIERWLDSRAGKRRKPIRRGKLRRGADNG